MKGDCRHRTVPLASFVRHERGLGARIRSSPCSSVAFAPSPPHLFPNPGALTWCTNPLQPLFLRRLCTKSPCLFPNPGALTWCTNPLQPLFFRRLCTKSPRLFPDSGALTWCTNPLQPLFLRRLCTKSSRLFPDPCPDALYHRAKMCTEGEIFFWHNRKTSKTHY